VQIHWHNPQLFSKADRENSEGRLEALAAGHSDLIDVRISAKSTGHHRHGGQEVRIVCQARGAELVAARSRPDAGLALNEALDAFEREVHSLRERRRDGRSQRPVPPPHLGIIDRVFGDEGYGFILTDAGERVYFHRNAVRAPLEFEELVEGQRIGLNLEAGDKGAQATVVVPAPPDAGAP